MTSVATTSQSADALREAERVARLRTALRGEIKMLCDAEARALLAEVLVAVPDWLAKLDAAKALCLAPGVGEQTAWEMLDGAGVTRRRALRDLSPRQRGVLAGLVLQVRGEYHRERTMGDRRS